jgi:hypothetical protein
LELHCRQKASSQPWQNAHIFAVADQQQESYTQVINKIMPDIAEQLVQ